MKRPISGLVRRSPDTPDMLRECWAPDTLPPSFGKRPAATLPAAASREPCEIGGVLYVFWVTGVPPMAWGSS